MVKKKSVQYKVAYYDETGKRRGKTFTAPTMHLARLKAAEWEINHRIQRKTSCTVADTVNVFIDSKENVLSPSTTRMYRSMVRTCIQNDKIASIDVSKLSAVDVQNWISGMSGSPKTIKNRFALLRAALAFSDIHVDLSHVKLPQPIKYEPHTPTSEDVSRLLKYTAGQNDRTLYRAILLAALGPLRISETTAIMSEDIHGNEITINKAEVKNDDGVWIIKTTKTPSSVRKLIYPDFVINELAGIEGRIIPCNPTALKNRFNRALRFAKVEPFTFHALRRYGASVMHTICPNSFVRYRGGWSSNHVMESVYIKLLDDEKSRSTEAVNTLFDSLFGNL